MARQLAAAAKGEARKVAARHCGLSCRPSREPRHLAAPLAHRPVPSSKLGTVAAGKAAIHSAATRNMGPGQSTTHPALSGLDKAGRADVEVGMVVGDGRCSRCSSRRRHRHVPSTDPSMTTRARDMAWGEAEEGVRGGFTAPSTLGRQS